MGLEVRFTRAPRTLRDVLGGRKHVGSLPGPIGLERRHSGTTLEIQDRILRQIHRMTVGLVVPAPLRPMPVAGCGVQTVSLAVLPGVEPADVAKLVEIIIGKNLPERVYG